jgi:hypothetical protein
MYTCEKCNYSCKFKCTFNLHRYSQQHFINTGDRFIPDKLYECKSCAFQAVRKSGYKKHMKSVKHKRIVEPPKLKECDSCNYKTYEMTYFVRHLLNHKNQTNMKRIIFKSACTSSKESSDKPEVPILDKNILKQKINDVLVHCRNNGIDPKKHFNYIYYCTNIDTLNSLDLFHFYKELEPLVNHKN